MDWIVTLFTFIFGTIIGSFLNVVALRYNTGMGVNGRSKCFSCGKILHWVELMPLVSFILQVGKCRKCKTRISWQYPVVEAVAGILFVLILLKFPPLTLHEGIMTAIYLFITCLMTVITIYDIRHKIIPDSLVYTFAATAFVTIFIREPLIDTIPMMLGLHGSIWTSWGLDIIAGPICALPFALIWLFSKGKWMGLGDAKLILGIGWLLGLSEGVSAVVLAFWIGAAVSILWMKFSYGEFRRRFEIPFAPYLIIGMYIVLFTDLQVIDIVDFLAILMS